LYVIILKNVKNKGAERNAAALWDDRVERATKDEGEGKVVKREAHTAVEGHPQTHPFHSIHRWGGWNGLGLGGKGKGDTGGDGTKAGNYRKNRGRDGRRKEAAK
jgi:hypothetical protein